MGGYGEVPGVAEDSSQLLPLMAMIRQGELSQDVIKVFKKYAHKAPKKEAIVLKEDVAGLLAELQRMLGVKLRGSAELSLKGLQELLWSCAMDSAEKSASIRPKQKKQSLQELFQVITKIGEGATGNVILAKDRAMQQRRAVKVVHKTEEGEPLNKQQLQVQEEFFEREVKVLSAMDHPHIIRLHQHFEDEQGWYLVLEYCPCGDLTGLMEEYREEGRHACPRTGLTQMPWLFTLKVTLQVLLALAHMHRRKVMHLDIKGQNIMFQVSYRDTIMPGERAAHPAPTLVMKEPHVILVDFGTAQSSETPDCAGPIGTCAFMAPEVWKAKLTPKADIFGLGVVLFQMLGGKLPFSPPNSIDLAQDYWDMEPLPPWDEVPYVAPQCQEVCDLMLQIQSRPSAKELLDHAIFGDLRGEEENSQSGIPLHYAHRLVNYAERDVLQKCVRMRLARAWASNQMPSFRRLFASLCDASGRLSAERLGAALSAALAESCGSAATTWSLANRAAKALVDEDGLVGFTLFVAALADLGDPKYEEFLLQSFEQVDEDDDGLLCVEDLAKLLSADMKKHAVLLQEYMVMLTGHDSPGAKFEFGHFLKHFQKRPEAERAPRDASESPEAPCGQVQGEDPFFQHFAGTLLDQAVQEMKPPS